MQPIFGTRVLWNKCSRARGAMKRSEFFGGAAVRVAARAAVWYWSSAFAVVVWSVSYLVRQPGAAGTTLAPPFSPVGDFALEGMLLALAWLGLLLAACLALLSGAAHVREP